MLARFEFRSSMPSTIVFALPNFLVSSLMRIRCCSFSISPQTHKSFGSPHVEQTSTMTLKHSIVIAIYKSFKSRGELRWVCRSKLITLCHRKSPFVTAGYGLCFCRGLLLFGLLPVLGLKVRRFAVCLVFGYVTTPMRDNSSWRLSLICFRLCLF
jgi:hypothetical protein